MSATTRRAPDVLLRLPIGARGHADAPSDAVLTAIALLQASSPSPAGFSPGEQQALETLYRAYMPMVRDTVFPLLASVADADDVTQTVFLGLPRALRRYRHGHFTGWLRQVAARTALMRLREARRASARLDRAAANGGADECAWNVALANDDEAGLDARFEVMRRAFYALSGSLREVVFLRAIVGLSHTDIAEWLDISVSASYTRYCRGLQQIRQVMEGTHE